MEIDFDLSVQAEDKLDQIIQFIEGSQQQLYNLIGHVLIQEINESFVTATDPWGTAWQPLKSRKGQPLRDTGRLKSSITYQVYQDFVEVGTNLNYAPYHQFGFSRDVSVSQKTLYFRLNADGSVGHRFVKKHKSNFEQTVNVKAHNITVPARPYLPINDQDQVMLPPAWEQAILRNIQLFIEGYV